jgi:hypothetical protein
MKHVPRSVERKYVEIIKIPLEKFMHCLCLDLETITMRQSVVRELTEKEEVFFNLQGVIGKFLDVDHIISHCVTIPRQEFISNS